MKVMNLMLSAAFLCLFVGVAQAQYVGQDQQDEEQQQVEPDFEAWCANGTRVLERAQVQASRQIGLGQFRAAAQTLLETLNRGVTRPVWNIKPITYRLIGHGHALGTAMLAAAGSDERAVKATVNALEGVYDLILDSALEIDRGYYRTRCGYCGSRGVRAFDLRIQRMVGDLLALVNGHMTYQRGGAVYPLGPSRAYLVGAEVVSGNSASELEQLVFAESLGCQIVDLDDVYSTLSGFNRRSSTEREKMDMFYDTYERLDVIIGELRQGRGCFR